MIIRILVFGDKGLDLFHKQVSHALCKINSSNNQTVYTCLDGQLDEIKSIASKLNLEMYTYNESNESWNQIISKRSIKTRTA